MGTSLIENLWSSGETPSGQHIRVVGGVDPSGLVKPANIDSEGRLRVTTGLIGTSVNIMSQGVLAAGAASYTEYTVPGGNTLELSTFYAGGSGAIRSSLFQHDATANALVLNGGFENSTEVSAWAAVTGSVTVTSSSVQFQTSPAAMAWAYSGSGTAIQRRQTFSPILDLSVYRYLKVYFFHDAVTGTTRTISIVLGSGSATRTYSLSGVVGTAPFTANTWIQLEADLASPTADTAGFNIKEVDTISLRMQDANNKSGTVYWDDLRLSDSLNLRQRIYSLGQTFSLDIAKPEQFAPGTKLYIQNRNTSAGTIEYFASAQGVLQ
jgi:hypothetical protein